MLSAWKEFKRGKGKKEDVQQFEFNLEDNIFQLHFDLKSKNYQPLPYKSFYVSDPKLRHIHKAMVRDRIVHQAIYRVLIDIFEKKFIFDSYSCRLEKGTHMAVNRLSDFCRRESQNYTKNIYGLKCDVKKFFDNIDHVILKDLIKHTITDQEAIWLLDKIINSFAIKQNKGLPLGNVTSQLLANIYLNELDWFLKQTIKIKYYLRYTDDFVVISQNKDYLLSLIKPIGKFLNNKLSLKLHPRKVQIRKISRGLDFLGYVTLPYYRVLRTRTKRRMFKKIGQKQRLLAVGSINEEKFNQSIQSYYGVLKHCRGFKIWRKVDSVKHS